MIEYHENAPEGSIKTLPDWDTDTVGVEDVILCRNTAPLIATAFALLSDRHPCRVLGKDIGQGLAALIKKMKANSMTELSEKLNKYETNKAADLTTKEKFAMVAALRDKMECIRLFMGNATSVAEVLATITELFNDKVNCTTLSTIHKAKGLEWTTVYFLDSFLIPSKYAVQRWQRQQEVNLIYVAITRAKLNLFYINTNDFQR